MISGSVKNRLAFGANTFVLVLAHYISFNGYNGSDDLHYAALAAKWLNGTYSPFEPADIFSGRFIHIAWQALWFRVLGIHDIAIAIPPLFALILMAYLLCFKAFKIATPSGIFFISALCYFNPFTPLLLQGNMPDVYIGLATIGLLLLFYQAWLGKTKWVPAILKMVFIAVAGWLIKETIVYPVLMISILFIINRKQISARIIGIYFLTLLIAALILLAIYTIATGQPLFRFQQIQSGSYINPCQYNVPGTTDIMDRLSFLIPRVLVMEGIIPLLMVLPFLITGWRRITKASMPAVALMVMLAMVWWLPVSLGPYGPLCHKFRHYFFLMPVAIWYLSYKTNQSLSANSFNPLFTHPWAWAATWLISATVCIIYSPYQKWLAIWYLLLLAWVWLANKKTLPIHLWLYGYSFLFFLSIAYPIARTKNEGYNSLKQLFKALPLNTEIQIQRFYFIDHDTKSHLQFISRYDSNIAFQCLDSSEFKAFKVYDAKMPMNEQPKNSVGWLVLNAAHTAHLASHFNSIDSLAKLQHWPYLQSGNAKAYQLPNSAALNEVLQIANRPQ